MKKLIILWGIGLAAAVFSSGCASGESFVKPGYDFSQLKNVAVLNVEGIRSKAAQNQIATYFNMELLRKGFSPVERGEIDRVLAEQRFQVSGVTSPENAAEAGRILNVDAVMLVSVPKFSEDIHMTARMVETETGAILWIGTGQGTTGKTAATILGAVGGAVAGGALGGDGSGRTVGAIAGGVAGGAAGYVLTPAEELQAQKVVKKVTGDLPYASPEAMPKRRR